MTTAFFTDERCFWHGGGNYAFTLPTGGLIQPGGGLPESPETKRRLRNLLDVTGLLRDLSVRTAAEASEADLRRVHPESYLSAFKAASDAGGGELGLRTPFGRGGFEIAALSAGLATSALRAVLTGEVRNAYALSRPPGHHCLPDWPNGFCLLNNIAIAIRAAQAAGLARRVAVVDWDVHHGNGTQAAFYADSDVLTLSIHQDNLFPANSGGLDERGEGPGLGYNLNIPLPPGCGNGAYLEVMRRIVVPALERFRPDLIVVACGFDASGADPLGRMMVSSEGYRAMTGILTAAADLLCGGRIVMTHEGGYSASYVPYCGLAVLEALSGVRTGINDPFEPVLAGYGQQALQPHQAAAIAAAEDLLAGIK